MIWFVGIVISLSLGFYPLPAHATPIRSAELAVDGVLNINTALGIATILQVPDTIQSIIIGDQSAFKVEFLDKAVTIKPLRWGAKTNLYLITEKQRFNLRLKTEQQQQADFIVYIRAAKETTPVTWRAFNKVVESATLRFQFQKLGITRAGFYILLGQIKAINSIGRIQPEQFWIFQNKNSKIINSLYLSSTKISSAYPVVFGLSIAKSDLDPKTALTFEFKGPSPLFMEI